MTNESEEFENSSKLVFRNYIPEDKSLLKLRVEKLNVIDIQPLIKDQLDLVRNAAAPCEITAENLQQKKIDEDLKRDLKKYTDILKAETRKVIVEFANKKFHEDGEV